MTDQTDVKEALVELDRLLNRLSGSTAAEQGVAGGAIDEGGSGIAGLPVKADGSAEVPGLRRDSLSEELEGSPRRTAVVGLSDHETIRRFRREVTDGLVRANTIRQVLSLLRWVLDSGLIR